MRTGWALAAVLVFAGCGGSSAKAAPPATSIATSAPTTTVATDTVAQVASKVASLAPDLRRDIAAAEAGCDGVQGICAVVGGVSLLTLTTEAGSLAEVLRSTHPRAEIGQLVTLTAKDADDLKASAGKVFNADNACQVASDQCIRDILAFSVDADSLLGELAGWQPYGVGGG